MSPEERSPLTLLSLQPSFSLLPVFPLAVAEIIQEPDDQRPIYSQCWSLCQGT